jgi:hypothetical protein
MQKEVKVKFTQFEPKKHSVRMKTDERLGGQYALADQYVPRLVLALLGLSEQEQNDPQLTVTVTYTLN